MNDITLNKINSLRLPVSVGQYFVAATAAASCHSFSSRIGNNAATQTDTSVGSGYRI